MKKIQALLRTKKDADRKTAQKHLQCVPAPVRMLRVLRAACCVLRAACCVSASWPVLLKMLIVCTCVRTHFCGAVSCRRKKMYEKNVDQADNIIMNIESQIDQLETAAINVTNFNAMQAGTQALKKIQQGVSIDMVEELKMDQEEQVEIANEISEVLAKPFSGQDMDEDDLDAELDLIDQEQFEASISEVPPAEQIPVDQFAGLSLPTVPSGTPAIATPAAGMTDEERELAELEASMG